MLIGIIENAAQKWNDLHPNEAQNIWKEKSAHYVKEQMRTSKRNFGSSKSLKLAMLKHFIHSRSLYGISYFACMNQNAKIGKQMCLLKEFQSNSYVSSLISACGILFLFAFAYMHSTASHRKNANNFDLKAI